MIAALRSWLAGFGHPTTTKPLPDPVTWTYTVPNATDATVSAVIDHECSDGWRLIEFDGPRMTGDGSARFVFHRTDGAYRWRDDGFKGY